LQDPPKFTQIGIFGFGLASGNPGAVAPSKQAARFRAGLPDVIHIFKPKIPIWKNFGGPWNGKGWHILLPFGIYYDHVVYFMAIC
jgi:hypothetical protein